MRVTDTTVASEMSGWADFVQVSRNVQEGNALSLVACRSI